LHIAIEKGTSLLVVKELLQTFPDGLCWEKDDNEMTPLEDGREHLAAPDVLDYVYDYAAETRVSEYKVRWRRIELPRFGW
jgi:hypothetical protein